MFRSALRTTLILILLISINIIGFHPRYRIRLDVSANGSNTLAPESLAVVQDLPPNVSAIGFYTNASGGRRQRAEELLNQYRLASNGAFDYQLVDPDVNPTLAREYAVVEDATLLILNGDTRVRVRLLTEGELTNAMFNALNPRTRQLYFVTGHGENNIADGTEIGLSTLNARLNQRGIQTADLNLLTGGVPADANLVVIAGAVSEFSAAEIAAVDTYLAQGGKLLLLSDSPETADPQRLETYISEAWGLTLQPDLVSDFSYSVLGSPVNPLIWNYAPHPISEGLLDLSIFLRTARSIQLADSADVTTSSLAETSNAASAIAVDGLIAEKEALTGLTIVGVAENIASDGVVLAIGDVDFVSNAVLQQFPNNALLFENSANWLIGDLNAIQLTPRAAVDNSHQIITLTDQVRFIAIVWVLPMLLVIGVGLSVRVSRRARK